MVMTHERPHAEQRLAAVWLFTVGFCEVGISGGFCKCLKDWLLR